MSINTHVLKKQPKMNNIRGHATQVRTPPPLTINTNTTTHNQSTGNRTFLLSPSPTTSYHPWQGTTALAPQLHNTGWASPSTVRSPASSDTATGVRTLGEFPWDIPGDTGSGYEGDVSETDSDGSDSSSALADSSIRSSALSSAASATASSTVSCSCCGLRHALSHIRITHSSLFLRTRPQPITITPPHHASIDALLLQIHLATQHTTPLRFLRWSFASFTILRNGERVSFPEAHYAHLPIRAMALCVAMDLEEGVLVVEGDVEGAVGDSLGVELGSMLR